MRWTTISSLVVLCLVSASCGGDESNSAESSALKQDGSRLAGCFANADCKNSLVCFGASTTAMMETAGFCTDACMGADSSCPPILGQAASCSPQGQCRIDCTGTDNGNGKCPAGMECRDTDPSAMRSAFRCVYPIGTGRGAKKAWDECNPAHADVDCQAPNVCVPYGNGQNRRGYCSASCTMDQECSAPAGATAKPLCAMTLGACSLDCTDGTCPKGMECIDTTPGGQVTQRCRYVPAEMMPSTMP